MGGHSDSALDSALPTGLKVYNINKFFPEVVGYTLEGVVCHHIVAVVDLYITF